MPKKRATKSILKKPSVKKSAPKSPTVKKKIASKYSGTFKASRYAQEPASKPVRNPLLPRINARFERTTSRDTALKASLELRAAKNILTWVNKAEPNEIRTMVALLTLEKINVQMFNYLLRTSTDITGFVSNVVAKNTLTHKQIMNFEADASSFGQSGDGGFCEAFQVCKYLNFTNHIAKIDDTILETLDESSGPFYGITKQAYEEKGLLATATGFIFRENLFVSLKALDPLVAVILLMALFGVFGMWEICECNKKRKKAKKEPKKKANKKTNKK